MTTAAQARQGLIDVTTLARAELTALWPTLAALPPDQVRDALMDLLPALGDTYGDGAAVLAAEWFDEQRLEAEARGRFTAEPAKPVTPARWAALARWGVDPLFSAEPDSTAALSLLWGGLQRTIADRHRLTIVENSIRDPQAAGWRRVGVGDTCGFCRILIDRGGVYTEATVTFRSHDSCNCVASPTWAPNVVKVSREAFRQSRRARSEATRQQDNERAREYIRDHLT